MELNQVTLIPLVGHGVDFGFCICFELPIFLLLATKVGITNAEGLKKKGNTLSYLRLFSQQSLLRST